MSKIVCFSGASNSGKTTTIRSLLDKYKECIYLPELIRNKPQLTNIDSIRRDAKAYLKLQDEVIREKIEQELTALAKYQHTESIMLVDRSIIDSVMYCTFYVDKSTLDNDDLAIYSSLLYTITEHINRDIYDKIVLFEPIPKIDYENGLRTEKLKFYQDFEFFLIKRLTIGSFPNEKLIHLKTNQINNFISNFPEFV